MNKPDPKKEQGKSKTADKKAAPASKAKAKAPASKKK